MFKFTQFLYIRTRFLLQKTMLPDPAKNPSSSSYGIGLLLSHSMNYTKIYYKYINQIKSTNAEPVKYSSFGRSWMDTLPHLKIMSERSDICGTFLDYKIY